MKKRICEICLILSLLLMTISVMSCRKKTPHSPDETLPGKVTQGLYNDSLPEGIDLNQYEYRVLTYKDGNINNESWNAYIEIEGYNNTLLNDAAFSRNCQVEERLNCFISCVELGGFMETATVLGNRILLGEDLCDVAIIQNSGTSTGNLVVNGMIQDVGNLPYMDLARPYYQQSANEVFTIGGKQYFFSGDMVCTLYSQNYIFGNLDEWKNRRIEEDPFQLVRDGEWTLDKCFGIIKDTYSDLNGNSDRDVDDFYGITGIPTTLAYCFASAGCPILEFTDTGFEMPVACDSNLNVVNDLMKELDNPDCYWEKDGYKKSFFDGHCLLFFSGSPISTLRDATFETMLLPFPKYNVEQEDYRPMLRGGLICVPETSINLRATGIITEAMFSSSSRYMRPAYIERFVELRVLRNPESGEMLNLIVDKGYYSFIDYFDPSGKCNGLDLIESVLVNRSNLTSAWGEIQGPVESGYQDLFDKLIGF